MTFLCSINQHFLVYRQDCSKDTVKSLVIVMRAHEVKVINNYASTLHPFFINNQKFEPFLQKSLIC